MTQIDNLTNASDQTANLVLPDNSVATLRLRFRPRTQRWVADVGYAAAGFQANGINVCCFPNILRAWRNILPFGIAFMTEDLTDPFMLTDFTSVPASTLGGTPTPPRVAAYLLNAADVLAVEQTVIGSPAA